MKLQMALLVAALGLGGCTLLPPTVTPVVPASTSVEQANRKLAEVAAARAAIESTFASGEQVCYTKFFVNNCLDNAKERRRSALAYQGAIEDEAQYYKRKAEVDERDREVARAVKEYEADLAREAAMPPAPPRPEVTAAPAPKAAFASRSAKRAAREAQRAAQDKAEAPKRAANVKEFEERTLEAEERQRKVAEKLAKKAAKAEAK